MTYLRTDRQTDRRTEACSRTHKVWLLSSRNDFSAQLKGSHATCLHVSSQKWV